MSSDCRRNLEYSMKTQVLISRQDGAVTVLTLAVRLAAPEPKCQSDENNKGKHWINKAANSDAGVALGHTLSSLLGFPGSELGVLDYPVEFIRQLIKRCFSLSALGGVIVKSINTLASHQISTPLFEGDGRCSFIKQTKQ
ncbi:unnamed protein product [Pleuronectes platessa]|uniref:Uncharacterized protein n=1 Tax=Pleuronectes platessa TaxID=8262 RepID=A0A9N7TTN9_PLEPL|nr:unnamed protein product [Pleuronectes platessa]